MVSKRLSRKEILNLPTETESDLKNLAESCSRSLDETRLFLAISEHNVASVERILETYDDAASWVCGKEFPEFEGMTALICASNSRFITTDIQKIIELLLENGANKMAIDLEGRTASQILNDKSCFTLAKIIDRALEPPQIGDAMKDGTIYAGVSPDTGKRMYAAPADAPIAMDFNAAAQYAKNLQVGNKKDFRVPTKNELNVLFENKEKGALKGSFNAAGIYGTSTPYPITDLFAYEQYFRGGAVTYDFKYLPNSIRCVR